ncbi:MAG: dihydrofolate reductase, partial [Chloroflexi bacterium]|nr:dihydrofolate reductase [Chloroflexota bacterium]
MTKYVASNTFDTATWANSTVLDGDLIGRVTKLKQDPGRDILMHGYCPVAKALMRHDLLNELFL